jgi:hypothetical protein
MAIAEEDARAQAQRAHQRQPGALLPLKDLKLV